MNEIQSVILNIFSEIKKICDNHEIPYFAIGGTCIGAVRHNGFIPWDDDLDIAIPIQYFDSFLKYAEEELPEKLKVYRCENVEHYRYIFAKIHDTSTTFIEEAEVKHKDAYKGIWVDIMPISSIPQNEKSKKKFQSKLNYYMSMNFIRRYPFNEMDSLKKKLIWLLIRPMCLCTKYSYYSDKWLDLLKSNPLGSSNLTGYTWWGHREKLRFPMKDFASTIDMKFEGINIRCPVGYDDYLTIQFGDYMTIPKKGARIQHNTAIISTTESYINYSGGEKK